MKILVAMSLVALLHIGASAQTATVTKTEWIDGMSTILPSAFCYAGSYFRSCFDISAKDCEELATSTTRICLSKHKDGIPDVLHQPNDGQHWGTVVGSCAGEAFEITVLNRRKNTAVCNDPKNWMK